MVEFTIKNALKNNTGNVADLRARMQRLFQEYHTKGKDERLLGQPNNLSSNPQEYPVANKPTILLSNMKIGTVFTLNPPEYRVTQHASAPKSLFSLAYILVDRCSETSVVQQADGIKHNFPSTTIVCPIDWELFEEQEQRFDEAREKEQAVIWESVPDTRPIHEAIAIRNRTHTSTDAGKLIARDIWGD